MIIKVALIAGVSLIAISSKAAATDYQIGGFPNVSPGSVGFGIGVLPPITIGIPYVPPIATNGLFIVDGDSRVANGGQALYTVGSTFAVTMNDSNGWTGTLSWLSGNTMIGDQDWNFGVGASTSAGIAARENQTGNSCAEGNASAAANCYLNSGALRINTNALATAPTTSLSMVNITNLILGMHVDDGVTKVAAHTQISGTLANPLTLSNAIVSNIASGSTITFVDESKIPPYWNYLDNTQTGWSVTDPAQAINATRTYNPCNSPANLVFFGTGTNDGNIAIPQSLKNLSYILDNYGPNACNKIVVAFNEMPKGMSTVVSEVQTPAASIITAAHTSDYFKSLRLEYAPLGTLGTPNVISANDGVALVDDGFPCTPAVGHFCVHTTTGIYTLNATDTGRMVLTYEWKSISGGSGLSVATIHHWYNSNQATFVDDDTGLSYNCGANNTAPLCSGAQYQRPWVHIFDSWGATVDNAVSSAPAYFPKAYYSQDATGLHPLPNAGKAIARVAVAAIPSGTLGGSPIYAVPSTLNFVFSGNSTTNTAANTFVCTRGSPIGVTTNNSWLKSLNPSAITNTGIYTVGAKINTNPAGSGIPHGTLVDCVDETNNQLHFNVSGITTIISTNTTSFMQNDSSNLASGIDHRLITTTTIANCGTTDRCGTIGTKGVPLSWTFAPIAADKTSLDAGNLIVNYGIETNPLGDGRDFWALSEGGTSTGTGGTLNIGLNAQVLDQIVIGQISRGVCRITVDKGPNGHLEGTTGIKFTAAFTQPSFTPAGASGAGYVSAGGIIGGGGAGQEYTDKDISDNGGNPIVIDAVTPPFKAYTQPTAGSLTLVFNSVANEPVSFKYRVTGCGILNNVAH